MSETTFVDNHELEHNFVVQVSGLTFFQDIKKYLTRNVLIKVYLVKPPQNQLTEQFI